MSLHSPRGRTNDLTSPAAVITSAARTFAPRSPSRRRDRLVTGKGSPSPRGWRNQVPDPHRRWSLQPESREPLSMRHIGFIVDESLDLGELSALSVFDAANSWLGAARYETRLISRNGGPVRSSCGIEVLTRAFDRREYDSIFIAGASALEEDPATARFLHRASQHSRRIVSLRCGVFTLGRAGLIDGRRVTTHWTLLAGLRERFPRALVEDDCLYVQDGPIWTSAGMTSSVDLSLSMLEKDEGGDVATAVARQLVLGQRRHPRQSQRPPTLDLLAKSDRVERALAFARANLRGKLSVEQLAEAASLSPRQFSRLFGAETGCSPAKAVERLRMEAAHLLVTQGRLSLDVVARETGFDDAERMRRAFVRHHGKPPLAMRRLARHRVSI